MSRIGKKPIEIPKGVTVTVNGSTVLAKGPKGELSTNCPAGIKAVVNGDQMVLERANDEKNILALHGLTRSLMFNAISGVAKEYEKVLVISGTGFRAQVQGSKIMLSLGFSHPVEFELPKGIKAAVDQKQTTITLAGSDKQQLGQIAVSMRSIRPPDIYKGKGVKYAGEKIKLKVGKAGKK